MLNVPKKKCEVCTDADSKYKCPQCLIYYCSLNCFKNHKDGCNKKEEITSNNTSTSESQSNTTTSTAENASLPKLVDYEDDKSNKSFELKNIEYDFVSLQSLNQLENSDELKQILANKHLRDLLTDINKHDDNIDEKMQKAMQEPLFQEFSDVCLKLVQKPTDLEK